MTRQRKPEVLSQLAAIAKYPLAYALFIVAGLVGFFSRQFAQTSTARTTDCQAELQQCRADGRAKDEKFNELVRELLIKQGVIDRLPQVVDSTYKTAKAEQKK